MEEIIKDVYRVQIPMPKNPLKYLNSYFIKGDRFNLIVDTGLNHKEAERILFSAINDLSFLPGNTKLFITHMHSDHCGLCIKLNKKGMDVLINPIDGEVINNPMNWEKMIGFAKDMGMPHDRLNDARMGHPGYRFRPIGTMKYIPLKDNEIIDMGNFVFRTIHTPGHTKGHLCLYEEEKKLFISGDHILMEITPNISQWQEDTYPLQEYLYSLKKIKDLKVDLVLPGHRSIFSDLKKRVEELEIHHKKRLDEVFDIVESHPGICAYEVASLMNWDMDYRSWEEFPMGQKWFATGEAQAHLNYLEHMGRLVSKKADKIIYFEKGVIS